MLHIRNVEELKTQWEIVTQKINKHFDAEVDLQGVLFLIGVQELGQGFKKFKKDEKQDLMHIATCRLLSTFGYYELVGSDEEGWPHWKMVKQLPKMNLGEQDYLLKQCIIDYFEEHDVFQD